jgi:two-component system, OmpR family, heavy metal sensor histidine kinase CusS
MTRRSITLRLTIFFALISSVILIAVGWHMYYALVEHFKQQDTAELAGKVELMRHLLSELKSEAEIPGDVHRFRDAMVGHNTLHLWLFGKDGSTIFGTSDFDIPADVIPSSAAATQVPGTTRDWYPKTGGQFRIMSAWGAVGTASAQQVRIVLVLDASAHQALLTRFRKTIVGVLLAAYIASVILGVWVTRRELRPLSVMAKAAETISVSRLGERLKSEKIPDEVRPLAEAFNAMLARLDDSFTRLSTFSSDLAHELRTPIANVVMHNQVILSKPRSVAEYQQALESNLEEFDRLTRMISDMLFLAKADHGQSALKLESLTLSQEASAVMEFFEGLAQEHQVKLDLIGDGAVVGDRLMVQRAIANLLSNAIRYTLPGNTVQIGIAETLPRGAQLNVSNPGLVIPPEHLSRLFDRFYRVDPAREKSSESSGLGLAIVKSIMSLHGGNAAVQSENGITRFTLQFVG